MGTLVAQMVKHLPAMRETWVRFLGWEDPLEKKMTIHSSTLPENSHWWKSLIGYSSWGPKESDTTEQLHLRKFRRTITVKNQIFRNIFNLMSTKRKKKNSSGIIFLFLLWFLMGKSLNKTLPLIIEFRMWPLT